MNSARSIGFILVAACLVWGFSLSLRVRPRAFASSLVTQQDQGSQDETKPKPTPAKPQETRPAQQQERRTDQEPAKPQESRPSQQTQAPRETPSQQEKRTNRGSSAPRTERNRAQTTQAHANYQFRSQDVAKLRQHYQGKIKSVNAANRPQLVAGGTIPGTVVTLVEPVPVEVVQILPPPPPGYLIGFCDGYIIVYDPTSLYIVAIVDLL